MQIINFYFFKLLWLWFNLHMKMHTSTKEMLLKRLWQQRCYIFQARRLMTFHKVWIYRWIMMSNLFWKIQPTKNSKMIHLCTTLMKSLRKQLNQFHVNYFKILRWQSTRSLSLAAQLSIMKKRMSHYSQKKTYYPLLKTSNFLRFSKAFWVLYLLVFHNQSLLKYTKQCLKFSN